MTLKEKQTKARIKKLVADLKKEKTLRKKLEKANKTLEKKFKKKAPKKTTKRKTTKRKTTKRKTTKRKNPAALTDSVDKLEKALNRIRKFAKNGKYSEARKVIRKYRLKRTWDRNPYVGVRISNIDYFLEELPFEEDKEQIRAYHKYISDKIKELNKYIKDNFR